MIRIYLDNSAGRTLGQLEEERQGVGALPES
jgi:hypothetical protein